MSRSAGRKNHLTWYTIIANYGEILEIKIAGLIKNGYEKVLKR